MLRTQKKFLIDTQYGRLGRQMFDDFFCLRKNIFDAVSIQNICKEYEFEQLINLIRETRAQDIPDEYRVRDFRLSEYIIQLQRCVAIFDEIRDQSRWEISEKVPHKARKLISTLREGSQIPIDKIDDDTFDTLKKTMPKLYRQISIVLRLDTVTDFDLES